MIFLASVGIYYDILLLSSYLVFEEGSTNTFMNLIVSNNVYQEIVLVSTIILLSCIIIIIKLYDSIQGLCKKVQNNKVSDIIMTTKNIL